MTAVLLMAVALLATPPAAPAQTPAQALKAPLGGIGFLVGDWSSGKGQVADTGGTSTGSSRVTVEAGGGVLLRKDHTELADAAGKPSGGFDQIMMIYPDGGAIHADYSDGSHLIHYTQAVVDPGKSVVFTSGAQPGAPIFKLAYALTKPTTLTVAFSMAPPGSSTFNPIATGSLTRSR